MLEARSPPTRTRPDPTTLVALESSRRSGAERGLGGAAAGREPGGAAPDAVAAGVLSLAVVRAKAAAPAETAAAKRGPGRAPGNGPAPTEAGTTAAGRRGLELRRGPTAAEVSERRRQQQQQHQ